MSQTCVQPGEASLLKRGKPSTPQVVPSYRDRGATRGLREARRMTEAVSPALGKSIACDPLATPGIGIDASAAS